MFQIYDAAIIQKSNSLIDNGIPYDAAVIHVEWSEFFYILLT